MTIDAAVDGQGIALARTALASSDLIAGRLVRPFELALGALCILDRMSQIGGGIAEDHGVHRMAAGASGAGRSRAAEIEPVAALLRDVLSCRGRDAVNETHA